MSKLAPVDQRTFDHLYHRTRIDTLINGNIFLVLILTVLALVIGERFQPFYPGASWLEPTRLVWVESEHGWYPERSLIEFSNFPPASNSARIDVLVIYPLSVCLVLVLGVIATTLFLYLAARRQTHLMLQVYAGDDELRPYEVGWDHIRVTFWALDVTLLFILFFFFT